MQIRGGETRLKIVDPPYIQNCLHARIIPSGTRAESETRTYIHTRQLDYTVLLLLLLGTAAVRGASDERERNKLNLMG